MAKTAFLGLGVMGYPMAGHLKAKGHEVTVYNRTGAKADQWVEQHGGKKAATPREAAKGRHLPTMLPGGIENPLGARALYIGSTLYRIHGTNQPWTIGGAVSSGCIRMRNEDVVDLYERVPVGTTVVVM